MNKMEINFNRIYSKLVVVIMPSLRQSSTCRVGKSIRNTNASWLSILSACAIAIATFVVSGCDTISSLTGDSAKPLPPLSAIHSPYAVKSLWKVDVGSSSENIDVNLAVAANANRVFTADPNGSVSAHLLETGKPLWRVNTKAPLSSGPVASQGYVIVGTNDGRVIALREHNGTTVWQTTVPNQVLAAPDIDKERVYIKTIDGKLLALKLADGHILWTYNHGAPLFILRGSSAPQVADNNVIAGFADGKLSAYDKEKGTLLWERTIALPNGGSEVERMVDIDADPVVKDDVAYTATYQGNLAAIDTQTGQVRWQHDLSTHRALTVSGQQLFAADTQSDLWAFDQQTGSVLWKQTQLENRGISAPAVIKEHVVVGDSQGYLHWLSREDGHAQARVIVDKSAITATPLTVGNRLIVVTRAGTLAAYSLGSLSIR